MIPLFVGEEMTCVLCGKTERSNPKVETQWRALVADGVPYYACPAEFPPDNAPAAFFKDAYNRVLDAIMAKRREVLRG